MVGRLADLACKAGKPFGARRLAHTAVGQSLERLRDDFRPEDKSTARVTARGLTLIVPVKYGDRYRDGYEPLSVDFLLRAAAPGMTCIDVGAHVGYYAMVMARAVGPSGVVHAFEPADDNSALAAQNVRENELNIVLHRNGVGATTQRRVFNITGSSDSHGFYEHPNTKVLRHVTVEQVALDDVFDEPPALWKVDTEGNEIEVLDGAAKLLAKGLPTMLVEWVPNCQRAAGREPLELIDRLLELGYEIDVLDESAGSSRPIQDVVEDLTRGRLAPDWYANLACRPRPLASSN